MWLSKSLGMPPASPSPSRGAKLQGAVGKPLQDFSQLGDRHLAKP